MRIRFLPTRLALVLLCLLPSVTDLQGGSSSSGKTRGNPDQAKPNWIVIKGKKASAQSLLAKLKPDGGEAQVRAAELSLRNLGLSADRSFQVKSVPGLIRIRPQNGAKAAGQLFSAAQAENVLERLRESGLYEYVEPDWIVQVQQAPTDTGLSGGDLWGLQNTGQNGGTAGIDVNALSAWGITAGDPSVVIGVIDTGIRYTHQDLTANMWTNPGEIPGNGTDDDGNGFIDDVYGINGITDSGDPMDDNDHGSHCAGTIAAVANNSGEHVGVAYNARLMALKFLDASGSGASSDAIKCIDYGITHGADILSNSWGGGGFSQALLDSIEAANAAGILFVAAAGNSSSNNDALPHYPSSYEAPNVVAVAAIDRTGALASFSSFGATTVDIGAPGVSILSCTATSDSSYDFFNGTSMATPHVAGAAALLSTQFPAAGITELKNRLLSSSVPLPALAGQVLTGGMVDAHGALTITADGTLEVRALAAGGILRENQNTAFRISVTDLLPVTGATVSASLGSGTSVAFLDNGIAPDLVAGDGVYVAEILVPPTPGGSLNLNVVATAAGKTPFSGSFPFTVVTPPDNDNFADRTVIADSTTQSLGSNLLASSETGEPVNPSVAGPSTVWWEWVSGTDSSVTISTAGSDFDTTLAIYDGTASLGSLNLVGSNDDSSGLQSSVTFAAVSGVSYFIQVAGYGANEGSITLNHPAPNAPAGAPTIISQPLAQSVIIGDPIALAVVAGGEPPFTYQWFKDGDPIPGANSDLYSVAVSSNGDQGDYHVTISNSFGSIQSNSVFVSVDPIGLRPPNDAFANATVLTGTSGRLTDGSNVRASGELGEPDHAFSSAPLASIWYRWTASEDGLLTVDTVGSTFDTTLGIYSGTDVASLVTLGSNDDSSGVQSRVTIPVTNGVTYHIAVDGYSADEGPVTLNHLFSDAAATANDDFADAIPVNPLGETVFGLNVTATGETGEDDHAGVSTPLNSVWWSWTAPTSGSVTIDTEGSNFDTSLAVYTGSAVDSLSLTASNDDGPVDLTSEVSFPATSGTTYFIAVDGYSDDRGSVQLTVTPDTGSLAPEIVVEQPSGTPLVDGVSVVDIGAAVIATSKSFTIRNTGTAELNALSMVMSGPDAADFQLTSSLPGSISPGDSSTFTIRFQPGSTGPKSATAQLSSNDADESPFDISLTGTALTPTEAFQNWLPVGIGDPSPTGTPQFDGISTLLKYAFNMDAMAPDNRILPPSTGTAGLPHIRRHVAGSDRFLRIEFIRRSDSGLIYLAEKSSTLGALSWAPLSVAPVITPINSVWERVLYLEPIPSETEQCFGRVEVTLP